MDANVSTMTMPVQNLLRYISFKSEKYPGDKLKKKSRFAGPEIFLRFEADLAFSRAWFSEIKVQIKRPNVHYHLSTCKSWWIMMSCTKKWDKITSFVNHCYIIREQRARKKPQKEKNAQHFKSMSYIFLKERNMRRKM